MKAETDLAPGRGFRIALRLASLSLTLIAAGCLPTATPEQRSLMLDDVVVATTPSATPSATTADIPVSPGASPMPSATPLITPTPRAFIYVFPVQPAQGTSYAPDVESHGYPAIDIFAPIGASLVAVTDGVVDFVSLEDTWDPVTDDPAKRGGLSVAIVGDDGMRYYGSHLSAVEQGILPGVRVRAGEVLGRLGNSGNARGKDVHLHFGISHPTFPEDWQVRRGEIDPFSYLAAWRIEIYITPHLP